MRRTSILILMLTLCVTSAFAHSGGTDSHGGHFDRSTGEYHYHHGYSAHDHPGGVCPYDKKSTQKTGSSTSAVLAGFSALPTSTPKASAYASGPTVEDLKAFMARTPTPQPTRKPQTVSVSHASAVQPAADHSSFPIVEILGCSVAGLLLIVSHLQSKLKASISRYTAEAARQSNDLADAQHRIRQLTGDLANTRAALAEANRRIDVLSPPDVTTSPDSNIVQFPLNKSAR